jgi:hypothetical protein
VTHDNFLTCQHELILKPGDEVKHKYNLIPAMVDHEPYVIASPRFRDITIDFRNVSISSEMLINQLETNIIITANGLGAGTT